MITLLSLFWTDGKDPSDRTRNAKFTSAQIRKLLKFLQLRGIDCSILEYDFSPDPVLPYAIHIPYKLGEYKRSEKINKVLKDVYTQWLAILDCDCFFLENEYENIAALLKNLKSGSAYTFDLKKLETTQGLSFESNSINSELGPWKYAWGHNRTGGFGGFFIVEKEVLEKIGGFDETYEVWGGEDGDALDRAQRLGIRNESIHNISVMHIPHFCDYGNELYFKRN